MTHRVLTASVARQGIAAFFPGQVEKAIEFAATEDARYEALAADPRSVLIEQAYAASASRIRTALEETRHASDLAAAKEDAAARWKVLAPLKPVDRMALVEGCREFRTPALCARLCDESVRAASRSASETVALAKLALRVTEAEILLREDRTGKVRSLVQTLQPDVESLGLKREALVAYRRFVAAVERDAATATQARELAKAIERSGRRIKGAAEG